MSARDVLITGIGLVSSLGEGAERHWQLFTGGAEPVVDRERFAPYMVHPLPAIDWGLQIAKRGDQRQMETWQRLGTYAAGLALDDAGAKGDEALCGEMDMIVAAGGGERDVAVDSSILAASETEADAGVAINRILTTDLRPTLFLAQLSNLLAGNISIVHKVTGSSRTFMGEEGAGIAAVETAAARIRAGQSSIALVGGAYQTEHPDMLLSYELGGHLHRGDWKPVWSRQNSEGGGVVTGSGAAFLVLESREHALKRGRTAYARLDETRSAAMRRGDGHAGAIGAAIDALAPAAGDLLTISGASGAHAATAAETEALASRPDLVTRGFSSLTGHMKEAQFPFAVAIAAMAVRNGAAPGPFAAEERPFSGTPGAALATTIGYWGSEGLAIVTRAE
jgi:3-oxoacyl-[acyl-carrier-protein] synthase II